jgi:beta-xylosidase
MVRPATFRASAKLEEIKRVTSLPVWVTECGVSSFGAKEVQTWGLQRTAELLIGLLREDDSPKPAAEIYPRYAADMGLCQWFHFEDHRLDEAVAWMKRLGVRHLRTGLSWALPAWRPGVVRPPNGSAARLRGDRDLLLHARTPRH